MRVAGLVAWALLLAPLSGCMKKDMERLENQVQLLDKRVELLQQQQDKANGEILESWKRLRGQLEESLGTMQQSSAEGSTRIEDLVQQMRTLSDRIEKTGFQYQRLSEQLAAVQDRLNQGGIPPLGAASGVTDALGQPPVGAGETGAGSDTAPAPVTSGTATPPSTAPPETGAVAPAGTETPTEFQPGLDPETTYRAAYADYVIGNYKLATISFQTYLRQFPSSAKAVLAQYFIGESYYALGQYREAVGAFDKIITGWPGDEKVPVAYLKKGYALLAMGQKALGIGVLQELISKHPSTHEALLAKERLSTL